MASGCFARSAPSAVAAALLATLTLGCIRPLALQDESLAPGSGSIATARSETLHTVRHHHALQAARRACAPTPARDGYPRPGPDLARIVAARDALAALCATTGARSAPVAAYGSLSNAHRRWVEDRVRELPNPDETAGPAGGG